MCVCMHVCMYVYIFSTHIDVSAAALFGVRCLLYKSYLFRQAQNVLWLGARLCSAKKVINIHLYVHMYSHTYMYIYIYVFIGIYVYISSTLLVYVYTYA